MKKDEQWLNSLPIVTTIQTLSEIEAEELIHLAHLGLRVEKTLKEIRERAIYNRSLCYPHDQLSLGEWEWIEKKVIEALYFLSEEK